MNKTETNIWRLFSELSREVSRLEVENVALKEKIGELQSRQKHSVSTVHVERIQWSEIESGKRFLTKKELGKYLGMGAGTISNQLSKGTFPIRSKKVGRSVRFDMKEILEYIETNKPFWDRDRNRKNIRE